MNERTAKLQVLKNRQAEDKANAKAKQIADKKLLENLSELKISISDLQTVIANQTEPNNDNLIAEITKLQEGVARIKLQPKITTPEVIVPEIKMPDIEIPKPTIIKQDNIFDTYKPSETDTKGETKYYGYVAKDGRWFIMRESETGIGEQYKYSSGIGEFKKAFSNRKGLNYKYYDEVEL